ncbi:MAG: hypothetical protein ACK47B_06015 [Armatimonadota bacterium]
MPSQSAAEVKRSLLLARRVLRVLEIILRPLAVGILVWVVVARLPVPFLADWLPVRNLVAAVLAVTLAGKTLYDTLFYERFWP